MAVKVFFYTLRPYDEQGIVEELAKQYGIEYGYTEVYPTMENAQLAAGCDAVSVTPCDMSAPMLQRFHDLGVKAICCRSIGYDHIDLEKARELGMKISNADYPPEGVANFAIMLMLMSLAQGGAHPQAGRSAGLLPEGQARTGYLPLHCGRHWHGTHRADRAEAPVRLWLPSAGLRLVPE